MTQTDKRFLMQIRHNERRIDKTMMNKTQDKRKNQYATSKSEQEPVSQHHIMPTHSYKRIFTKICIPRKMTITLTTKII